VTENARCDLTISSSIGDAAQLYRMGMIVIVVKSDALQLIESDHISRKILKSAIITHVIKSLQD
jgi:hypothetical protein